MDKKITYALVIGILIISFSVAYYFVIFLPPQRITQTEQEKQDYLFKKQTECKNICEKLYEDEKKSFGADSILNPRYAYNENKNTCFYAGGWLNLKNLTKRIVNCQTNEEVLTFMTIDNKVFTSFCDTCVNTSEEYNAEEKEFMGSN